MDCMSLSPSDNDLFRPNQVGPLNYPHQPTPAGVGNFSKASVPETPLSLIKQHRNQRSASHAIPSTVHISHGSSLLNIQSQHYSSSDFSASPSLLPPERRGRTGSRSGSSCQLFPTPLPPRRTSTPRHFTHHPGLIITCSRTQHHHAPARSPGHQANHLQWDSSIPAENTEG